MSDTFCIIPARSGSKGIKNKNILMFKGKTLIKHSFDFAKKLKFIKKIIVSTDNKSYLKKSEIPKTYHSLRPNYLSLDYSSTIDVVKYEYNKLKENEKNLIKYILILQPTCPFRIVNNFNKAYKFLQKNMADSAITVNEVLSHPNRMLKFKSKNLISNYMGKNYNLRPRQKLEKIYIRSGSMYFFKKKNIFKKNVFGTKVLGIEVFGKYRTNIDMPEDIYMAKKNFNEK